MELRAKLNSVDHDMVELYNDKWLMCVTHVDNLDFPGLYDALIHGDEVILSLTRVDEI